MPSQQSISLHTLQCEGIGGAHVNESFSSFNFNEKRTRNISFINEGLYDKRNCYGARYKRKNGS